MRKFKQIADYLKVYLGIIITASCFLFITAYIFAKGISAIDIDFIFGAGQDEGASLFPAAVNTFVMIILTLAISVPVGIGSAIYLTQYAKTGSKIVKAVRLTTESLAGIPSIIYGLFGFLFFVLFLGWSWSMLAGVFTLSIMILPTIMRSTEESLKEVPSEYRDGSFALGAGKLRTIIKILLPSAISGILVSIILSIGRIVGETAALVLTAGTVMKIPQNLMGSGSSLSVYMYTLTAEGSNFDKAYATAIVLMIIVFVMNLFAKVATKGVVRGDRSE